jgi:hypothetical protein
MAFKDHNCTCDRYCRCPDGTYCACENMGEDPHCMFCCQHLTPGMERAWREDLAKPYPDEDQDNNPEVI